MSGDKKTVSERISMSEKNKSDKKWYEDKADMLDAESLSTDYGHGNIDEFKRMKVNFDLFNNKLNLKDFEYVCKPFGSEVGELPAKMVNRDISSGKIKAMLGMEAKRPFIWNAVATNPEATTRKEQEETKRIREYTVNEILKPIRKQIELQKQEELQGRELTPEEKQQFLQQIEEEMTSQTPDEVKKYMKREHQDPAEVMSQQLLKYLLQKCDMKRKFTNALKYGLLSARSIMYVGIHNGEPEAWNTNSMRFRYAKSPDLQFIEDAENATCEYIMTPSQVIKYFGKELTDAEKDKVFQNYDQTAEEKISSWLESDDSGDFYDSGSHNGVRVLHCVWKSLRKIGFLYYLDENNEEQMMMVDENYKINKDHGDIKIEWEWIPECYETWKILNDIYVHKRPIPGQFKDLNNLYHCKLPYYGVVYDNMNSEETSLMDRMKTYQYYYNIIMYKLELLFASDKGKKVLMNINMIPDSAGINIKQWQYFMESTPYMWYDPNEQGKSYADANTVAKVIDLSLISDIQKYIDIAEYLRTQLGKSVGITDAVEGQIGPYDAAANTQRNLIQSSHILEPYFELHSYFKRNVLQALLETAKIAYSNNPKEVLTYVLDDMSVERLKLDVGLLDDSTIGIFMSDSSKAEDAKQTVQQLAHAAMQSQKAEFSDIMSVVRQENVVEAEETLKVAEENRREHELKLNAQQGEQQQKLIETQEQNAINKHERDKELIVIKEEERRKTEIMKAGVMGASFNPDQDKDNNGVNDFIQIAKQGVDEKIKTEKNNIDRDKLEHQKITDKKKLEQKDRELKLKEQSNKQN